MATGAALQVVEQGNRDPEDSSPQKVPSWPQHCEESHASQKECESMPPGTMGVREAESEASTDSWDSAEQHEGPLSRRVVVQQAASVGVDTNSVPHFVHSAAQPQANVGGNMASNNAAMATNVGKWGRTMQLITRLLARGHGGGN